MVLNVVRNIVGILFPLISFPYVARVLGVDNLGKYNFANSIVYYFSLLSALGISMYATSEGAKIRDDKAKITLFASNLYTINLISTVVSYVLLICLVLISPKIALYWQLIFILSLEIVFRTIGVEWVYSIYEDFLYVTIRSILINVINLVLLFAFVKKQDDILMYCSVVAFTNCLANILNRLCSSKYCRINIKITKEAKQYIKPILFLFATNLTISIYVSSDSLILGILSGDYAVGIYSASVKVYTLVKTIIAAIVSVAIPRLAAHYGQNDTKKFNEVATDIYFTMLTLVIPAIIGMFLLRKDIIILIAGYNYLDAVTPLSVLGAALFFCLGAYFWGQAILVPVKEEKILFYATLCGAILNILLNILLIPKYQYNAAAITTLISEGFVFFVCRYKGNQYVDIKKIFLQICKIMAGSFGVIGSCYVLRFIVSSLIARIILSISVSILVYCTIEVGMKNESVYSIYYSMKNRFKIRNKRGI